MTVIELSHKTGVAPHVIRFYTRLGLLRPASNPSNRYKAFAESDVARLHFIRRAQSLGFTLKEIAEIFAESSRKQSPCPTVRKIITRRIAKNREKLEQLTALQMRMEEALAQWSAMPDGVPKGEQVCHLIESFEDDIVESRA